MTEEFIPSEDAQREGISHAESDFEEKNSVRTCAYCNSNGYCGCKYKAMRLGGGAVTMQNTSRQSTVAEMREEFNQYTSAIIQQANAVWSFSVTTLDKKKLAKADAKRKAKKVANRLLGKEK